MDHIFPEESGKKVLGVLYGGIGDCLMIANTCSSLCDFTFCVRDHQRGIVDHIKGCKTESLEYFKDQRNFKKYDAVVNFLYFLTSGAALKSGGYYSILEKKIARKSPLSGFDIATKEGSGIYIHMQASNPNRDWTRESWAEVIPALAEIDHVYLLGCKADFQIRQDGVTVLSDENDTVEWQAEKLSTAKYFVGVDSGFCHIAGILGKQGSVLFFNTLPSDVIHRYPTLSGVDAFGDREPSRSLRVPCETSEFFKKELKPAALIQAVQKYYN